jgi:hypothetical protein
MGARPIIRNPENKKLLTLLGSFTLTLTMSVVGSITSTPLITFFILLSPYYRLSLLRYVCGMA